MQGADITLLPSAVINTILHDYPPSLRFMGSTLALYHNTDELHVRLSCRAMRDAYDKGCTGLRIPDAFAHPRHLLRRIQRCSPNLHSLIVSIWRTYHPPHILWCQVLHAAPLLTSLVIHSGSPDLLCIAIGCPLLQHLNISRCDVDSIAPLQTCAHLKTLDITSCLAIHDLSPLHRFPAITDLIAPGIGGATFHGSDIHVNVNVNTFIRRHNPFFFISSLALLPHHCTSLRRLCLRSAGLVVGPGKPDPLLSLKGCSALTDIDLAFTRISDVTALGAFTTLEHLDFSNTFVKDLTPLSSCTALRDLCFSSSMVHNVGALQACTALTRLEFERTFVEDLTPLSSCTALQRLCIGYSRALSVDALQACTALTRLDIDHTDVKALPPLAACTALVQLDISFNYVDCLKPLASCLRLQHLDMAETEVTDMAPLGACTALKSLNLTRCSGVYDLTCLAACTALTRIVAHKRVALCTQHTSSRSFT